MRIAQLIAGHGSGGLEKHVRDLTAGLLELGHELVVVGDPRFLATLPPGTERIPVRIDRNRRHPLLLLDLLRKLRGFRGDLIHAHANKAASLLSSVRPWLRCPTIGTLHNMKRDVSAFRKLDSVITVSRQLAWPFPQQQVSVVYNGIIPPHTHTDDLAKLHGLPVDRPILVGVGRLVVAKGFDVLLEAIDGLPVSLVIAGEGPERGRLERRAAQMSPPTTVRFVGQHWQATSLMASAHAVIIPSRREGFSYVFNEAVLCHTRVLATDVPVANEVLPKSLLVPVGDSQALRARLSALLADTRAWDALMTVPRQTAQALMTRQAMCAQTLEVYRSAVAKKATSMSGSPTRLGVLAKP